MLHQLNVMYTNLCGEGWNKYQMDEGKAVRQLEREEDERLLLMKDGAERTVEDRDYQAMIKDREVDVMNKLADEFDGQFVASFSRLFQLAEHLGKAVEFRNSFEGMYLSCSRFDFRNCRPTEPS